MHVRSRHCALNMVAHVNEGRHWQKAVYGEGNLQLRDKKEGERKEDIHEALL